MTYHFCPLPLSSSSLSLLLPPLMLGRLSAQMPGMAAPGARCPAGRLDWTSTRLRHVRPLLSEILLSHGLLPTAHSLSTSLTTRSGLSVGHALHGYIVKLVLSRDSHVATTMLGMYARAGDTAAARVLFNGMWPDSHVKYAPQHEAFRGGSEIATLTSIHG